MTDLSVEVNHVPLADHGWLPDSVNVAATDEDEGHHINVRITDEGMILDSYDGPGALLGTV